MSSVKMRHIKFPYGEDPTGNGFFWPASNQKRQEWLATKRSRPAIAESVYQCRPGSRESSIFVDSDFRFFRAPPNLAEGLRDPEVAKFCRRGETIIQAWDTAFSATESSDFTVCVTLLLVPSDKYHNGEDEELLGPCDSHFMVFILDVFRDKLTFHELVPAARRLWQTWQPSLVVIEKKAYGTPLLESLENTGINLEPVTPIQGKLARATDSLGAGVGAGSVQGWFRQGRVYLPADADWTAAYVAEMKDFDGSKGGRDDQVDATVHGIQYAIRMGGSSSKISSGWETVEAVDARMAGAADSFTGEVFGLPVGQSSDPFDGMCGRCKFRVAAESRCTKHRMPVSALHSCFDFEPPDSGPNLLLSRAY